MTVIVGSTVSSAYIIQPVKMWPTNKPYPDCLNSWIRSSTYTAYNEYQLDLGRQRQVWYILIVDWTCGCAGKTVRSLENTCHIWALLRWWFTKRRYNKCTYLYLYKTHLFTVSFPSSLWHYRYFELLVSRTVLGDLVVAWFMSP